MTIYSGCHRQPGRVLIVSTSGKRRFIEALPLKVLPDPPAELLRR
jgi:hypothetical protein